MAQRLAMSLMGMSLLAMSLLGVSLLAMRAQTQLVMELLAVWRWLSVQTKDFQFYPTSLSTLMMPRLRHHLLPLKSDILPIDTG